MTISDEDRKELCRMADEARGAFGEACRDPNITKEDFDKLRAQYMEAMRRYHESMGFA